MLKIAHLHLKAIRLKIKRANQENYQSSWKTRKDIWSTKA